MSTVESAPRFVVLDIARKGPELLSRYIGCDGCHEVECAGPERLGEITEDDRHAVSTRALGGRPVDLDTHDPCAGDGGKEMRGDRTRSRTEVCRRSSGRRQQLGRSSGELLALRPWYVHTGVDAERVATERLHACDPGQWLALFTPCDPRLGGLFVLGQCEELARFLLGCDATSGGQPIDHGRRRERWWHPPSLFEPLVPMDGRGQPGMMSVVKKVESDAMRSVEGLVDALAEARSKFREVELSFQRALRKADRSGDIRSALLSTQLGVWRQSVNDAIDEIERQRREMRLKLFALASSEHYSIGEMGRLFGFSRQLASKYANELSDRRR